MILLSHPFSTQTPTFGGHEQVRIDQTSDICRGDLCNSLKLSFPNHCGTHIDMPKHFVRGGASITDFEASDWILEGVLMIDVSLKTPHLDASSVAHEATDESVTTVLLRTGWEQKRGTQAYTHDSPGLSVALLQALESKFPKLRAVGMDFISACRYGDEGLGIEAHRYFLAQPKHLLIEDMALARVSHRRLGSLLIAPLLIEGGDGAPATIFAWPDGFMA